MKVLLDTNIILDALMERTPFDIEAKEILLHSQNGDVECQFTANAVTQEDCINAISLPIDDFEDALVVACAQSCIAELVCNRFRRTATQLHGNAQTLGF